MTEGLTEDERLRLRELERGRTLAEYDRGVLDGYRRRASQSEQDRIDRLIERHPRKSRRSA